MRGCDYPLVLRHKQNLAVFEAKHDKEESNYNKVVHNIPFYIFA